VPFYCVVQRLWHEITIRKIIRSPKVLTLVFLLKCLAFIPWSQVRQRFCDIKRLFQGEVCSEVWNAYEKHLFRDDYQIQKWNMARCEHVEMLKAMNRQSERQSILIDEQVQPSTQKQENLMNLISGIKRLEQVQREEYELEKEKVGRWYPQFKFLQRIMKKPQIVRVAVDEVAIKSAEIVQGNPLVNADTFLEGFNEVMEAMGFAHDLMVMFDSDDQIQRLSYDLSHFQV